MLDAETKRRIDSCRDILVGKVPDPKSQVEQITIALIYKFMDDMDAEAEELGGRRAFFAGDFAKYGWAKVMAPQLGGYDVLNLYSEAIGKMNENPGVPTLFRDIFKNAYLPYRDPETLRSFLKEINGFTYDHSERLGDAFEYLLSVLGSQGDAGQFRTPRHIIDFMVALIDPQKDETILDPACGTAGFLISAYKHILNANRRERPGDALTPDERKRLAGNFHGYDISPDMVRLSLVNLYLHGFTNPRIEEYDTLTSEERWHQYADVILANPPFMSPKGGIKPHKRFTVQANRSEVLFVDYIAEHLTPTGRAAVVVPEGIIFQSGTAYKQLRKLLVEGYLVAVISLPAGVFNPYSGVKTSILLMDRRLAKKSDQILFAKIENDGFGLGAQRRAIDKNDLPETAQQIKAWLASLHSESVFEVTANPNLHLVERARIGENGEWNLSGERYRSGAIQQSIYQLFPFMEVCTLEYGASLPQKDRVLGEYPVVGSNGITGYHNEYLVEGPTIVVGRKGSAGEVTFIKKNCYPIDTTYYVKLVSPEKCDIKYIYHVLTTLDLPNLKGGAGIPGLNRNDVYEKHQIPLPPLAVQQEIMAEIEGYQQIIDGARQVVEHYRPRIAIDPAWPVVPLGELFQTKSGTTPRRDNSAYFENGRIPWVKTLDLTDGVVAETEECITELALQETHLEILPKGTVLVAMYGGFNQIGRTGVLEIEATHNQAMTALLPNPNVNPYFLNTVLVSSKNYWKSVANSTRKDPNITKSDVLNFPLPLPDLATQRAIVAEIEEEQRLVAANRALIDRFTAKIQRTINRVWEG